MAKVVSVGNEYILKELFYAWVEDYKESRRARMWFNREIGGGEREEGGDDLSWYWEDGADPISLLPIHVSIKVSM